MKKKPPVPSERDLLKTAAAINEAIANGSNIVPFEDDQPQWINFANICPRNQPWLWDQIIPLETSTLFAGTGGIGKSLLLLNLIAWVTQGGVFECCGKNVSIEKGSVILMSAEDSEEIQIVPKLMAAGADFSKLFGITSVLTEKTKKKRFLSLSEDLHYIEKKLIEIGDVKLLIIDPIAYFIGDLKDHIGVEVCNFIQGLNDLATKYKIAIILNKHLRKKSSKQTVSSIIDEVGGSGAWVNTPRQAFAIMTHPEDEEKILMLNIKVNIAKRSKEALVYRIEGVSVTHENETIRTAKIVWADKTENISLDAAGSKEAFQLSKQELAQKLIYDYLSANGVTRIKVLYDLCKDQDIAQRTIERAAGLMVKEKTIKRANGNLKPHYELVGEEGVE